MAFCGGARGSGLGARGSSLGSRELLLNVQRARGSREPHFARIRLNTIPDCFTVEETTAENESLLVCVRVLCLVRAVDGGRSLTGLWSGTKTELSQQLGVRQHCMGILK